MEKRTDKRQKITEPFRYLALKVLDQARHDVEKLNEAGICRGLTQVKSMKEFKNGHKDRHVTFIDSDHKVRETLEFFCDRGEIGWRLKLYLGLAGANGDANRILSSLRRLAFNGPQLA